MHLIWANLVPNLIRLWTGEFKDLDHTDQGYLIKKKVWETLCTAAAESGSYVPSAFGAQVPNFAEKNVQKTCEMHSIWTLYFAPSVLRRHFKEEKYYRHFVSLIKLLNHCLEFEITHAQIDELETGFQNWVKEYEKYVKIFIAIEFSLIIY